MLNTMKARDKALLTTTVTALLVFMALFAASCLTHFLRGPLPGRGLALIDQLQTQIFAEAAPEHPEAVTSVTNSGAESGSVSDTENNEPTSSAQQNNDNETSSKKSNSHSKPKENKKSND